MEYFKMNKKILLLICLAVPIFAQQIVVKRTLQLPHELLKQEKEKQRQERKNRFQRDDSKEVVIDKKLHLIWHDDSRAKSVKKKWKDAKAYCKDLTFAGYSDWHLPTIDELESITDTSRYNPAIKRVFKNVVSSDYFSSSLYASDSEGAWGVSFSDGGLFLYGKAVEFYVRCVRVEQ